MKRLPLKITSLILVLLTLLGIFSSVCVFASANKVSTTAEVRLRSSAKITDDNVITTLSKSEELTLLKDSTNGWAYVSRDDGTKGYCSLDYLAVPAGSKVTINGVTTEEVNFRKGPSSDYDSIKLLAVDTEFTVVDNTESLWVKAKIDNKTGYIYRTYTKLGIKLPKEETTTPEDEDPSAYFSEESALESLLGEKPQIESAPARQNVILSDTNISVEEGQSYTLTAYTSPQGISGAVNFKSSDKSVLTVSAAGVVTGKKAGSATVTAYIKGTDAEAVCTVEVTPGVTVPKDEIILSATELDLYQGNHAQLTADKKVKWKSTDKSIVSVSGGFLTAVSTGTATITAYTDTQSVDCVVKVKSPSSKITVNSTTATVTVGKTYFNGASSAESVEWTSSDTSVAKVDNGFITAVSKGKAIITAKNSLGVKTCLVTVKDAEPVRFAYTSPNTASIGEKVTFYAVTDTIRTDVKFEVAVGNKTITVNAEDKKKDGNTYVWSGTSSISKSGTFDVTAYAKTENGDFETCTLAPEDAKTTVFVRKTKDLTAETMETRRATDELISLIASFEGYSSSVYFDTIANNLPTLGYGKVLYLGDSFYNDMTRKEAYAYLVQAVNNDGYTSSVNSYLNKYNINRNQQQFDSLVSFVYNLGSNILSGDSDFKKIFTAVTPEEGSSDKDAYINATNVNLRSGPSTSDTVIATLNTGDLLTLVKTEPKDNWYQVKTQDGKEGYVYADYVSKGKPSTDTEFYLSKINQTDFMNLMLQYHHAGPSCVNGLLYRRVDELEVFYKGEYSRNGADNKYGFRFTCPVNSSTKL